MTAINEVFHHPDAILDFKIMLEECYISFLSRGLPEGPAFVTFPRICLIIFLLSGKPSIIEKWREHED